MRAAVRRKLGEVLGLVEQAGYPSISAHLTFDHPETELAYPYDADRYSPKEALAKSSQPVMKLLSGHI